MSQPKDLTLPDFPHGTAHGYSAGCRRAYPCPEEPSCADLYLAVQRARRKANGGQASAHPDWPKAVPVQRRLEDTINAVGIQRVAEYTGLTVEAVEQVRRHDKPWLEPVTAEALGHAWAWLVHSSDTRAPDFPHGRPQSYNQGRCRCQRCATAVNRRQKAYRARTRLPTCRILVSDALGRHVERLVAAVGAVAVGKVANLDPDSVTRACVPGVRIQQATADKLAAVTVEAATPHSHKVPATIHMQRLRSMCALGYPVTWIAEQSGVPCDTLEPTNDKVWLFNRTAAAIDRLAAKIGDTPAAPENTGLESYVLDRSRRWARKQGWYPPMCYDADGTLIVRAIADHPWAKVDERAANLLEGARHVVRGGTQAEAAKLIRCDTRSVSRNMRPLGLKYGPNPQDLDLRASKHAIRRVLDVYADYEAGEIGPVEAALTLGLVDANNLLASHPEVAAWRQRQETAA